MILVGFEVVRGRQELDRCGVEVSGSFCFDLHQTQAAGAP